MDLQICYRLTLTECFGFEASHKKDPMTSDPKVIESLSKGLEIYSRSFRGEHKSSVNKIGQYRITALMQELVDSPRVVLPVVAPALQR